MASRQHNAQFHKNKTLDNKYMLGDEIGKGAYGRVYKGLDLENGDFVAIKQVSLENIPQEDLNIIMQEIDLLKNLNHKNIVKYLGSLKTRSHLHIILEYVENGSLANIIKPNKFGPFPESLVAVYIAQVLEGLVYLHEQGVIHRDIKGANILTTKEGLVKLADFGVATKLTEADINTHSVVGTPYWMAPEVIEMSGVCAASDIWSVGCTVIELLTCAPPYYDLQPMPALFRIVQDVHPPIPEGLSPEITDFLRQCFQKDAIQRPDAKTLLMHPWLQNSRRALPSLRQPVRSPSTVRDIDGDDEGSSGDNHSGFSGPPQDTQTPAASDLEQENGRKDLVSESARQDISDEFHDGKLKTTGSSSSSDVELMKDSMVLNKDPTLVFHEKLSLESSSAVIDLNGKVTREVSEDGPPKKLTSTGQESRKGDGKYVEDESKDGSSLEDGDAFTFQAGRENINFPKEGKASVVEMANELSRFSDTPGDASFDDLFPPKKRGDHGAQASTSSTGEELQYNGAQNDLAKELKNRMAQKQKENDSEPMNGGELLKYVMRLREEDIDGTVFDEGIPGESLFPLQSVEYSKIVAQLKPGESEEVILSSCQKLMLFFNQRPEQKQIYVSQNGFLPLMELLELPKNRIITSVLQLINQIVKDNTNFLENACLVGLIPVVMNFAVPDRAKEVRVQASRFLQQLCQASTLTLQMFIACQGIPVLVSFLEPDYAKYSREMVHLAIDGIWQVFKLQHSTPRNDFCRIAAKNGILIRLVNTLHSLNEATRFASISGSGTSVTQNGSTPRRRSGQLDPAMLEISKTRLDHHHSSGSLQSLQADADRHHIILDPSSSPRFTDMAAAGHMERNDNDPIRPQRLSVSAGRTSTDRSPKHIELVSNGHSSGQNDQIRPLLSLLEKEPPSRHVSGQLDYVGHLSGLGRHESILPLLHASTERKTNGELDLLMAEFAEVSRQGRENGNLDSNIKTSNRVPSMKYAPSSGPTTSNEGASTSGAASQTASGVLSGSGVLNARPGSTTSSGLLAQMVSMSADVAREYLEKVADLLLEFAQADTVVKSLMSSQSLLARLFQMFNKIEPPILLKILRCINHLSGDPNCLETLQRTDAIKHLIPILELRDGPLVFQIHSEVLNALFNLCKINKRRQEQAAENGIIPHLMNFVMSDSPLRQYALPLLCDMAHASRNSREQLRAHGGLDVYLNLLEDDAWACTALDSIAVCLSHDNDLRKVEQALLKKEAIQKLVKFFQECPEQYFIHILDAFLKIITKSSRINTAMATNGLTTLLIARLDHREAIARLTLLKLIKVVYEHHPRPKQLIVENDLPQKLQNLIEERRDGQRGGQQVLVKQMATSLLKALHINTVL
ncbi:MAP3K epsilon protein kinase 1-like isoform X4 [Oryza brachyantha]|uniref:MAP3K epsilon protein kinase 1-like isoform X4 n=1 Tax=Oryza brachyantha TaxID=4533 RepID=UPI0007760FD5|nr:MAP3K epsilon protein kinase 1-like isoform X4 [Oryza brachyantha]